MTTLIVVGALVLVVLAIGSAALPERSRGDAGRTSRRRPARPAGTAGAQPSPLVEALGHAIEAATDDESSRGVSGGAPPTRTAGAEREDRDRPHHAYGPPPAARPDRAERDDDPPRGSGSSGDSGGWSWGGSDD